jgi:hypothetical protein
VTEKIITLKQVGAIVATVKKTLELQERQKKLLRDLVVGVYAQYVKQDNHGSLGTSYEWERKRDEMLNEAGFISDKEMKRIRFQRRRIAR